MACSLAVGSACTKFTAGWRRRDGMGEVYRARDTSLERDVAIKVLAAAFSCDEDRLERFAREARLLASLNHPNIAAIFSLEQIDGGHALVLELVDGSTLAAPPARAFAQRTRRGSLPAPTAVRSGLVVRRGGPTASVR